MKEFIFDKNNYYRGWQAASKPIDYKRFFPKSVEPPEEVTDKYGNLQYKVKVSEETIRDDEGEHVKRNVQFVKHRQVPTEAQISRRKKQLFKERYSYDRDDEIALMKDAINEMRLGKELLEEYTDMEAARAQVKQEVHDEIEADLFTIAKEHGG